jgi:hypothetical protein
LYAEATLSKLERGTIESRDHARADARIGAAATPGKHTLVEAIPDRPATRSPVQCSGAATADASATGSAPATHAAAAHGIGGNSHALPFGDTIQRLFGRHDIGGIRAHSDAAAGAGARAMGARAFATGDHVAFASPPDLHTAAHEAAHVVQQRAGVQLNDGVGETGDAYEHNADAVADRVLQGMPADDLLPAPVVTGSGAVQRAVQRQGGSDMTQAQLAAALSWAAGHSIDVDTIRQVQEACGAKATGTYDEATARAVFAKQRELKISADGIANANFCHHIGVVFTHAIKAATISDPVLQQIAKQFPDGVTVAAYAWYDASVVDGSEFQRAATVFAQEQKAIGMPGVQNQSSVGLSGGALAVGQPCPIYSVGDVIEVVQSIHRGLVQKWNSSQTGGATGSAANSAVAPPYTKVKNLALFTHGESYGVGLDHNKDFYDDGLRNTTKPSTFGQDQHANQGVDPSNVNSFVRGLTDAVTPDVRVLLYGCSAGAGPAPDGSPRDDAPANGPKPMGDLAGDGSLAQSLAELLGPKASVYAHSTIGHVTGNSSARVFGAEGGGQYGISIFELMYPEEYIQAQLKALSFPADAGHHDALREEMLRHFDNSVHDLDGQRRYNVNPKVDEFSPIGREMFIDPAGARERLHADWETWIKDPLHLARVTQAIPK